MLEGGNKNLHIRRTIIISHLASFSPSGSSDVFGNSNDVRSLHP